MKKDYFWLNGFLWRIRFTDPYDPDLIDRTGNLRVATTDPNTNYIVLSNELSGEFLRRVFIHELGHCVLVSYDLLRGIRMHVKPEYWIVAEEWICNFVADYNDIVSDIANDVLL